jgi:amino acid adenylation domain-containing protein
MDEIRKELGSGLFTSSIEDLLSSLRLNGVTFWLKNGRLQYRAPEDFISSKQFAEARIRSNEITKFIEGVRSSAVELSPLVPRKRNSHCLPLSYAQERLWVLEQLEAAGAAYNIVGVVRLSGALDVGALERSFAAVVERHEGLRTRFAGVNGSPVQVIDPAGSFELAIEDLSKLPGGESATRARERVRVLTQQPFDLERGPLFRVHLLRLSMEEHEAVVVMHHIVSDGWSIGVLIREVGTLYAAFSQGRPSPLPALAVQYADYALWQRAWLEGDVLGRQVGYWKDRLSGAPAALELPTDRVRPAVQTHRGANYSFALSAELTRGLSELARREGVTLFMVLLAAFQVLLSRWSGQTDVVVGTPVAGRTHREVEGLIGFFVNTLALRTELSGDPSFREFLGQVRETALGAYAHQDLPFGKLVEELQPARDLSRQPVFQVLFALQNVPQEELRLAGLRLRGVGGEHVTAKFDLSLSLQETAQGLRGSFEYATDLFDGSTIERLAGHYRALLEGIVANPYARIGELPLLGDAERRQLLVEWNDTAADYPKDKCLHELFTEQAGKTPDAVAVVYEDSELSYGELDRRSNRLAHYLRGLGVGPDVIVGLCVERSVEMVIGLLGILKAGGIYLPLDPSYPAERLGYMLADAKAPVVVTQTRLLAQLPEHDACVVQIDADWAEIATRPASAPHSTTLPDSLAYVIYTSGSTGKPKGVMSTHGGIINRLLWMDDVYGLTLADRVLQKTPLSFDVSVWEFFWPLITGAGMVLARPGGHLDPLYLASRIVAERITIMHFVPSMLRSFLAMAPVDLCTSLREVMCSGEALPPESIRTFAGLSLARLNNLYGPTEASVDVTLWRCDAARATVSVGRPISNTRVYVLDGRLEPVPIGVAGELYVGGAGLARGYLHRAWLTAERFLPSPYRDGDRLYRTGDLVRYLEDGNLEFLGRLDHQVKIRGFRIELGEIEARLVEHPAVGQAIVVAREDTPGDKRLVAYVVAADAAPVDAGELRLHLKQSLPEYMVPSAYVVLEALPLTPNGKLDRRALPAPEADAVVRGEYVAPRTPVEEVLASLWCEVLKLDRVGVHDNFFELGGHSLLALTLIERMRRQRLHLSIRTVFTAPTLAELAAAVDGGTVVSVPANLIPPQCTAITPEMLPLIDLTQENIDHIVSGVAGGSANVEDIYPLAPLQEGILFHHLMADGDAYLLSRLLGFASRERLNEFVEAVQKVIDRHDILRTAVVWEGLPEPAQVVWRLARLPVEEVTLDAAGGDVAAELRARFDVRRFRFDVRCAPLARAFVARDALNDRWVLLLLHHHLAIDHTTLEVLIEEVQAHLLGRGEDLPAAPPFRDFVAQVRLGVRREEHEAFFRRMLGDVDEPTAPFGLLDVRGDGSGIDEAWLGLEGLLGQRLRARARALEVSAASLFHLAWAQVLARLSGRDDVVFGTALLGRMHGGAGTERGLGMFMNTLPVRIVVGEAGVAASVRQTQALLAELLHHEHASLALVQRCSSVPAPTPLFSALLNYRHGRTAVASVSSPAAWPGITVLGSEERTNYPLTLSVDDLGDGFALIAQVERPLDPHRICGFMQTALSNLVEALETRPDTPVCDIEVLPDAERHRLLVEWNDTAADYPRDKCIHELFAEQVAKTPDAVAVAFEDRQLSYGELECRAKQLAHHLRGLGVGPETVVGLCVERSIEMVVGLLGILKAGGAYLPLDPGYPPERLAYMLSDARAQVLVTQAHLVGQLPEHDARVVRLDADGEAIERHPAAVPASRTNPDNLAYVIYTSGSTGRPKGIAVPHHAIARLVLRTDYVKLGPPDRLAHLSSPSFDATTFELWGALLNGSTVVVINRDTVLSPHAFADALRNRQITTLFVTTALFNRLAQDAPGIFARVRDVLFGGEAVDPRMVRAVLADGPPQRLLHVYGPTEATTFSTWQAVTAVASSAGTVAIGRPIANGTCYVLGHDLEPVPLGAAGELYIGGDGLGRGYLNRPGLTAERFVPNPFGEGDRLYRTGDRVRYLEDGNLEFLGRVDRQVKIRGFRIELGEIEARLVEHPAVGQAIVVAREDTPGDKRLVAYVVAADAARVDAGELHLHLKRSLPEYMVPSAYVVLEALPLTPNGKLDRRALPTPEARAATGNYVAPCTPVEEALTGIWSEVLRVERVGIEDNFFELGGHSLTAMRVIALVRETLAVELPVRALFEAPTVRELAELIVNILAELLLTVTNQESLDESTKYSDEVINNIMNNSNAQQFGSSACSVS